MNEDHTLVTQAKAGDFGAFEQLVDRHERRLYGLTMSILHRREDAEDAVQTAFLQAMEHLGGFREEASFATWITRIATNAALKILRRRKGPERISLDEVTNEDEEGVIPHPEFIADWRDEPTRLFEQKELARILTEAMDNLPEKHRLVFALRDVAGLSIRETAKELGISEANVKVRLLRARLALRDILTRVFGDENRQVRAPHQHEDAGDGTTKAEVVLRSYQTN